MTTVNTDSRKPGAKSKPGKRRRARLRHWKLYLLVGLGVSLLVMSALTVYFYQCFSRQIDARLAGETERADPRIFARPFELRRGQAFTIAQLIDRLNDLGYSHRAKSQEAGEFTVGRDAVLLIPRDGDRKGELLRVVFGARRGKGPEPATIDRVELPGTKKTIERFTLDPPLITAARDRRARKAPRRSAERDSPADGAGGARDRGSPLLRASRHRSDRPRQRAVGNVFGSKTYMRGGSTHHAAARQEHLPHPGKDAQAQAARVVHVGRARAAAVEGSDPRAVPERRLARAARIVRHPRRAGSGAALLRQGRHERVAERGGAPSPA